MQTDREIIKRIILTHSRNSGDYLPDYKYEDVITDILKQFSRPVENFVRQGEVQPVLPCGSCAKCKFEEFYDKFGSHCNKHSKALNEMFDILELTLDEIGCKQFEPK